MTTPATCPVCLWTEPEGLSVEELRSIYGESICRNLLFEPDPKGWKRMRLCGAPLRGQEGR